MFYSYVVEMIRYAESCTLKKRGHKKITINLLVLQVLWLSRSCKFKN